MRAVKEVQRGEKIKRKTMKGKDIRHTLGRTKRGESGEELGKRGIVTGAVNQYVQDGEADPTTCANCVGLASYYIAVSKERVANAKTGQGDLLMTIPVARRLPRTQWLVATDPVYCHQQHTDSSGIAKWCGWTSEVN